MFATLLRRQCCQSYLDSEGDIALIICLARSSPSKIITKRCFVLYSLDSAEHLRGNMWTKYNRDWIQELTALKALS